MDFVMRTLCIIASAVLLAGCTEYFTSKAVLVETGAEVADEVLANVELIQCRAISIGAWQRRYGQTQELTKAWNTICIANPITMPPAVSDELE